MKKIFFALLVGVLLTGMSFTRKPASEIKIAAQVCSCTSSYFSACLNKTIYFTFYYNCSTGAITSVTAKDGAGNPMTVNGPIPGSTANSFSLGVIDQCNLVILDVTYNTALCAFSITTFRCYPNGGC